MKKTISTMLFIIILISLTACGSKTNKNFGNTYIKETDYPNVYESKTNGTYIAESPTGYYYLDGHFIFYADKQTMTSTPLCNKPECKHLDETDGTKVYYCNAYLGESCILPYIQYYDDKIYTVEGFDNTEKVNCKNLIEISPDGSKRKRLTKLIDSSVYGIHRGYLYECVNGIKARVQRVPMDNLRAEPEIIFNSKLDDSNFYFTAKGKYIYWDNSGTLENEKAMYKQVFYYDTEKKSCTQIIAKQDENGLFLNLYKSNNSALLYSKSNPITNISDANNRKIYVSDLDGANEKLFKDYANETDNSINNYCVNLNSDGTYYFEELTNYMLDENAQKAGKFIVYDKNFNKLYEDDKDWLPINHWFTYGGDDHIFINYEDAKTDKNIISYVLKSNFSSGKFEIKTLSENTFGKTHPGIQT